MDYNPLFGPDVIRALEDAGIAPRYTSKVEIIGAYQEFVTLRIERSLSADEVVKLGEILKAREVG